METTATLSSPSSSGVASYTARLCKLSLGEDASPLHHDGVAGSHQEDSAGQYSIIDSTKADPATRENTTEVLNHRSGHNTSTSAGSFCKRVIILPATPILNKPPQRKRHSRRQSHGSIGSIGSMGSLGSILEDSEEDTASKDGIILALTMERQPSCGCSVSTFGSLYSLDDSSDFPTTSSSHPVVEDGKPRGILKNSHDDEYDDSSSSDEDSPVSLRNTRVPIANFLANMAQTKQGTMTAATANIVQKVGTKKAVRRNSPIFANDDDDDDDDDDDSDLDASGDDNKNKNNNNIMNSRGTLSKPNITRRNSPVFANDNNAEIEASNDNYAEKIAQAKPKMTRRNSPVFSNDDSDFYLDSSNDNNLKPNAKPKIQRRNSPVFSNDDSDFDLDSSNDNNRKPKTTTRKSPVGSKEDCDCELCDSDDDVNGGGEGVARNKSSFQPVNPTRKAHNNNTMANSHSPVFFGNDDSGCDLDSVKKPAGATTNNNKAKYNRCHSPVFANDDSESSSCYEPLPSGRMVTAKRASSPVWANDDTESTFE